MAEADKRLKNLIVRAARKTFAPEINTFSNVVETINASVFNPVQDLSHALGINDQQPIGADASPQYNISDQVFESGPVADPGGESPIIKQTITLPQYNLPLDLLRRDVAPIVTTFALGLAGFASGVAAVRTYGKKQLGGTKLTRREIAAGLLLTPPAAGLGFAASFFGFDVADLRFPPVPQHSPNPSYDRTLLPGYPLSVESPNNTDDMPHIKGMVDLIKKHIQTIQPGVDLRFVATDYYRTRLNSDNRAVFEVAMTRVGTQTLRMFSPNNRTITEDVNQDLYVIAYPDNGVIRSQVGVWTRLPFQSNNQEVYTLALANENGIPNFQNRLMTFAVNRSGDRIIIQGDFVISSTDYVPIVLNVRASTFNAQNILHDLFGVQTAYAESETSPSPTLIARTNTPTATNPPLQIITPTPRSTLPGIVGFSTPTPTATLRPINTLTSSPTASPRPSNTISPSPFPSSTPRPPDTATPTATIDRPSLVKEKLPKVIINFNSVKDVNNVTQDLRDLMLNQPNTQIDKQFKDYWLKKYGTRISLDDLFNYFDRYSFLENSAGITIRQSETDHSYWTYDLIKDGVLINPVVALDEPFLHPNSGSSTADSVIRKGMMFKEISSLWLNHILYNYYGIKAADKFESYPLRGLLAENVSFALAASFMENQLQNSSPDDQLKVSPKIDQFRTLSMRNCCFIG